MRQRRPRPGRSVASPHPGAAGPSALTGPTARAPASPPPPPGQCTRRRLQPSVELRMQSPELVPNLLLGLPQDLPAKALPVCLRRPTEACADLPDRLPDRGEHAYCPRPRHRPPRRDLPPPALLTTTDDRREERVTLSREPIGPRLSGPSGEMIAGRRIALDYGRPGTSRRPAKAVASRSRLGAADWSRRSCH
jgi:hypothetical protein